MSKVTTIEKLVRAKIALEKGNRSCSSSCALEDSGGFALCSCGAAPANAGINAAKRLLDEAIQELAK